MAFQGMARGKTKAQLKKEHDKRNAALKKALEKAKKPKTKAEIRLQNLESFVTTVKWRLAQYKKKQIFYSTEEIEEDLKENDLL